MAVPSVLILTQYTSRLRNIGVVILLERTGLFSSRPNRIVIIIRDELWWHCPPSLWSKDPIDKKATCRRSFLIFILPLGRLLFGHQDMAWILLFAFLFSRLLLFTYFESKSSFLFWVLLFIRPKRPRQISIVWADKIGQQPLYTWRYRR